MSDKSFKSIRDARNSSPDAALKFAKEAIMRIGKTDDGDFLRRYLLSVQMEVGFETDPNKLIKQSARREFSSELLNLLDGSHETQSSSNSSE